MSKAKAVAKIVPIATPHASTAYDRVLGEMRRLPTSKLVAMNLHVPTIVATALGALPRIRALRPRAVNDLPNLDITRFDKLETYTRALVYAHTIYETAAVPSESLERVPSEALALRDVLLSDARALATRDLIDGKRLLQLKRRNDHRNVALDLLTICALLRANWSTIESKTALEIHELERAEWTADQLMAAIGQREQGVAMAAEAARMRHRAFTLFVSAYDHARRAVIYLRWEEGDADEIAPSLYAGRGSRTAPPKNLDHAVNAPGGAS